MSILATFDKQPADVQDYDIDFGPYLTGLGDTAVSHAVVVPTGITLMSSGMTDGVVKVWLSGGENRQKYKITVQVTTNGGRVKEAEIIIKVKEV